MTRSAAKIPDLGKLEDMLEDTLDTLKRQSQEAGDQAQEAFSDATAAAVALGEAAQRFAVVARRQAKSAAETAVEEIREHPLLTGAVAALAAAALAGWAVSRRR